jgi:TadE-like protein
MVSAMQPGASRRVRRGGREDGQALVEFALLLPLFLLLVVGIIQFAVGLNFWLDMQRVANQGARWAVVNEYPGCPRSGPDTPCTPTLQEYLASNKIAKGENYTVRICFPTTAAVGEPVKVILKQPIAFASILNFFTPGSPIGLNLSADATMRLEQTPGRFTANGSGPC